MKSYEIGDRFSVNNQYPAIATDGAYDIVVWEESRNGRGDRIMLMAFKDGSPVSEAMHILAAMPLCRTAMIICISTTFILDMARITNIIR